MQSLGQAVNDGLLRKGPRNLPMRGVVWTLSRARRALIRVSDPLVSYRIGKSTLRMPLSHDLPHHQKTFPFYSLNLGRLAGIVYSVRPELAAVDVGANVGDSVAILRLAGPLPVLAIEGNRHFFELLENNAKALGPDLYLRCAMVGEAPGLSGGAMKEYGGSAYFVEGKADPNPVPFETLSRLIDGAPELAGRKLLIKIDTDGLDCKILKSEERLLADRQPVVFFEYDPFHFQRYGDDGFAVFDTFRRSGYSNLLIYENTGDLLMSLGLDQETKLRELHDFYSGRGGQRYADICVFHRDDARLFEMARDSEVEFFKRNRSAG
jgi:FkbM family methyltransferase